MAKAAALQQATRSKPTRCSPGTTAHARALPWRVARPIARAACGPTPIASGSAKSCCSRRPSRRSASITPASLSLWPTVAALAAAPLDAVLVEWAGLGYYARARNLHACAQAVVDALRRAFSRQPRPSCCTLPGIGPYTAAAIAAIAFDEPVAVVDGNVDRVLARYLALPVPVRERQGRHPRYRASRRSRARRGLRPGPDGSGRHHLRAALGQLPALPAGRRLRRPRAAIRWPFRCKAEKPTRPTRYGHAFIIRDADGDVFLRKRPPTGLLAQMTEDAGLRVDRRSRPSRPFRSPPTGATMAGSSTSSPISGSSSKSGRRPRRIRRCSLTAGGPIPRELDRRGAADGVPQGAGGSGDAEARKKMPPVRCGTGGRIARRLEVLAQAERLFHLRADVARAGGRSARGARSGSCARRSSRCRPRRPAPARRPGGSNPDAARRPSEPSARTSADQRRRPSNSSVPGAISPISTSEPKATRGACRLATAGVDAPRPAAA